jgi:hypothetical protein
VLEDSYAEFRLQVQNFAQVKQYPVFAELVHHVPEAKKINQMVGPAITGYIQQLDEVMPDILNNLGRRFIRFKNYRFEIINSHFDQLEKHQVAISFFSEPMIWHGTIDNYLLLSSAGQGNRRSFNKPAATATLFKYLLPNRIAMSLTLSPGKIFLDEQRGFSENEILQRYCTFNFDGFQREGKEPFGNLYTLNDEVLSAGSVSKQLALHNNYLLLIPVTGAITYTDNSRWLELEPGEAVMIPLIAGRRI